MSKISLLFVSRKSKPQSMAFVAFLCFILSGLKSSHRELLVFTAIRLNLLRAEAPSFPSLISLDHRSMETPLRVSLRPPHLSLESPFTAQAGAGPGLLLHALIIGLDSFYVTKNMMSLPHSSSTHCVLLLL